MKLHQLNYFIAVAEEGSVGRAATRLNISQPPLTRQIHQLELELDVQLFERHPGGMALTEAGQLFLEEARHARAVLELAVDRVKRAGRGELGRLDIGVFGSGILGTIPEIIHDFRTRNPGIEVALHSMTKDQQILALRNRTLNIAFNRMIEPQADIVIERIGTEELYLAVNRTHNLAARENCRLSELTAEQFILFPTVGRPGFIEKVRGICHEFGFVPRVTQEVGDVVSGIALVAAGFGVSLVPHSATSLTVPNVSYKPITDLPDSARVDLSCMYLKNDNSPTVGRFLTSMREFVTLNRA